MMMPEMEATETAYENALRVAETLTQADRRRLARKLLAQAETSAPGERVSILELEGLGKELWAGVDPVAHVRAERDSWDR
jgi:hypothetical protein